jgi:hypothetical protein
VIRLDFSLLPCQRTPQKSASKNKLEAASARKTRTELAAEMAASGEIRPEGSMGAAKTAEEGSHIQPEPGLSGGCGGHAEVKIEAWTRATKDAAPNRLLSDDQGSKDNSGVAESQDLISSPKKNGKFNQKSAYGNIGEWHVPPEEPASVDEMEDAGWSNDGEGNNLASPSFGSDTEYLSETYVVIDSEVKINGSLAMGSLLRPGIIGAGTSALDKQFVERTVFFPVFTRYFLARAGLFEIMIEDLLKHMVATQNDKPPLVLSADVPRLRHIAHKRMGYLRATYRLFKDTVSQKDC